MHIEKLSYFFTWPSDTFTVEGTDFGTADANYLGLKMGPKVIPLSVVSWTSTKITVKLPAVIISRLYFIAVFKKAGTSVPPPAGTGKITAGTISQALKAQENKIATTPLHAPSPGQVAALLDPPVPLSNAMSLFVAMGPPAKTDFADSYIMYFAQVAAYRKKYNLPEGWETYMTQYGLGPYHDAFVLYSQVDKPTLYITYAYSQDPSLLLKPFPSETKHMEQLEQLFSACFPGPVYNFKFLYYKKDPGPLPQNFASIQAFTKQTKEQAGSGNSSTHIIEGNNDGVLIHEFAHRVGAVHHLLDQGGVIVQQIVTDPGAPGFEPCVMGRREGFCHACCMIMGLDYELVNSKPYLDKVKALLTELNSHFPAYNPNAPV